MAISTTKALSQFYVQLTVLCAHHLLFVRSAHRVIWAPINFAETALLGTIPITKLKPASSVPMIASPVTGTITASLAAQTITEHFPTQGVWLTKVTTVME